MGVNVGLNLTITPMYGAERGKEMEISFLNCDGVGLFWFIKCDTVACFHS